MAECGRGDSLYPHHSRLAIARTCVTWMTDGISTYSSIPCWLFVRGPVQADAMLKYWAKRESRPRALPMISTSRPRTLSAAFLKTQRPVQLFHELLGFFLMPHNAGNTYQLLKGLDNLFFHPVNFGTDSFLYPHGSHLSHLRIE